MQVILKRPFVAFGDRYRKGVDGKPVELPDSLRKFLPRDAKIVGEAEVAEVKPEGKPVVTLRDHDGERDASDAGAEVESKAERFHRELEAERKKRGSK